MRRYIPRIALAGILLASPYNMPATGTISGSDMVMEPEQRQREYERYLSVHKIGGYSLKDVWKTANLFDTAKISGVIQKGSDYFITAELDEIELTYFISEIDDEDEKKLFDREGVMVTTEIAGEGIMFRGETYVGKKEDGLYAIHRGYDDEDSARRGYLESIGLKTLTETIPFPEKEKGDDL